MTTVERLAQWKHDAVITDAQHEVLGALVRKDRFPVALELNALLYLGVLAIAAGVLWTVREHFARDFLTRHRDKLLFGSDCNDRDGGGANCLGAQIIATIRRLAPDRQIERKLLYENAKKLFRL